MKKIRINKRTPASRAYFQAFYEKNHINFLIGIGATVLSMGVAFGLSWMLGAVMDTVTTGDLGQLKRICLLAAGIMVLNSFLDIGYYGGRALFIHQALRQYKSLAFRNLSAKSISAFSQENTGRYLSTLTNDIATIETDYLENSFSLLTQALLFIGALSMMCWYSPLMTVWAIILSIPPILLSALTSGPMSARAKAVSDTNEAFTSQIKDLLSGFSVIKSFKAEKETQTLFDASNRTIEESKCRRRCFEGLVSSLSGTFSLLFQFGMFLGGAYLSIHGDITSGTVIVFVNLSSYLTQAISQIPRYWASRKAAAALIEKLAEVTEKKRFPLRRSHPREAGQRHYNRPCNLCLHPRRTHPE